MEVEDLDLGPLRRTFNDVTTGGLLAYVGSGGAIEIAVRNGSAARRLGIGIGGRVRARLG
jgi:S-adenosyl-L-methionine hydrolase (adenosine-forming)